MSKALREARMALFKPTSSLCLAGFAVCFIAMPVQSQGQQSPWSFVTYELLSSTPDNPSADPMSAHAERLLKQAVGSEASDADNVLMEGWLSSNTYGRIYKDREIYAVVEMAKLAGTEICKVTVRDLPDSDEFPYMFSFGGGKEWCSPPGKAHNAPTASAVRKGWQRGQIAATSILRSTEGARIEVRHIANLAPLGVPFTVVGGDEPLTFSKFPRKFESLIGGKHDVWVTRLRDGNWGMVIRMTRTLYHQDLSACFLTPSKKNLIPTESWISPQVIQWCNGHADAYFARLPENRKLKIVPTMGRSSSALGGER